MVQVQVRMGIPGGCVLEHGSGQIVCHPPIYGSTRVTHPAEKQGDRREARAAADLHTASGVLPVYRQGLFMLPGTVLLFSDTCLYSQVWHYEKGSSGPHWKGDLSPCLPVEGWNLNLHPSGQDQRLFFQHDC